jgi:hypothetical protein
MVIQARGVKKLRPKPAVQIWPQYCSSKYDYCSLDLWEQ